MNNQWYELITILAGFLATTIGLLRMAMNHHKLFVERMLALFDESLKRQTTTIEEFRAAVHDLSGGVRDNSQHLQHLVEWLQVTTPIGGSDCH